MHIIIVYHFSHISKLQLLFAMPSSPHHVIDSMASGSTQSYCNDIMFHSNHVLSRSNPEISLVGI